MATATPSSLGILEEVIRKAAELYAELGECGDNPIEPPRLDVVFDGTVWHAEIGGFYATGSTSEEAARGLVLKLCLDSRIFTPRQSLNELPGLPSEPGGSN